MFCDVQEHTTNRERERRKVSNLRNDCFFENDIQFSKAIDQMFVINTRNKYRKHKKVSKLKPGEIILIDLTKEDELMVNKKKNKRRNNKKLEWLQMTRKKYKVQKQNNEVKCSSQAEIVDAHSKENSENFTDNILLEHSPVLDNKISESTESCTSLEQEPIKDNIHVNLQSIYGYILNKRNNELKCLLQHKQCDTSSLKQINLQRHKLLGLLKLLDTVGQNIKVPKTILNLLKESREENEMSQHTFFSKSTANKSNVIDTQGKEESFFQPKSSIETIPLSNECQNNLTSIQSIKQELSTNCNMTQADTYCRNQPVYVQSDCHLHDFISMNSHGSQVTEAVKQKLSCDTHECTSYCKKIEMKPFSYHNNSIFNMIKSEDVTQNSTTDKKLICDKNVICMLSDLDKCMNVLNRIGEHIMTVHAEKQRLECSDKTDMCTIATTISEDQIPGSSSSWVQNINSFTNLEKLNKILELYDKKDLPHVCNCQDFHRWNDKEINATLNQLKYDSNKCKKIIVSTSQPRDYYTHGKDNEDKSSRSFLCNYIKSEIEQSVKKEDNESFRILSDESEQTNELKMTMLTNNHTNEFYMNDSKNVKEPNQDVHCENFSKKINITKTRSVDEFENTDILDNILNGDITIEDEQEIMENWQSPLMSPINYDNSNNVLNCIAEFFSQSEHTHTNKKEEKYIVTDAENSQTPLPEGSLGTIGILNSLFDFDLTNMDFPSNDFMYSNVQAVNPRLIKKTFETEIFSTKDYDSSELNSQDQSFAKNKENIFLQKEKELCSNRNYLIDSSVDVVGFGLNTSKQKALEFPLLIKNSSPDQSANLVNSDGISSEVKESFPKCCLSSPIGKLDTDSITEKSYIFQKEDTVNQIECFNDTVNQVSSEICTSNEIPLNPSINCTSRQQDDIQSSDKHVYLEFETNPSAVKQPLDSCDLLSSIDLMSCNTNTIPQCIEQEYESSIKQKNMQRYCTEKKNYTTKHRVEVCTQSRSSNRKLKCKKKIKMKRKKEESRSINILNHQDTQNTCELPLSTFHVSYCQKSPQITTENEYKQFKCVGIQRLRNISQRKQQMLLNFHNDTVIDAIFKEDPKLENFKHITEDNISEDSNVSCSFEDSHISDNKTTIKFLKNTELDEDVSKVNITTEISNNMLVQSDANWSLQKADKQSSKFIEKQMIVTLDEEMPLKRRKLASKLSTNLEANAVVYSVNQQKMQKKHFTSVKKGKVIFLYSLLHFKYKLAFSLIFAFF